MKNKRAIFLILFLTLFISARVTLAGGEGDKKKVNVLSGDVRGNGGDVFDLTDEGGGYKEFGHILYEDQIDPRTLDAFKKFIEPKIAKLKARGLNKDAPITSLFLENAFGAKGPTWFFIGVAIKDESGKDILDTPKGEEQALIVKKDPDELVFDLHWKKLPAARYDMEKNVVQIVKSTFEKMGPDAKIDEENGLPEDKPEDKIDKRLFAQSFLIWHELLHFAEQSPFAAAMFQKRLPVALENNFFKASEGNIRALSGLLNSERPYDENAMSLELLAKTVEQISSEIRDPDKIIQNEIYEKNLYEYCDFRRPSTCTTKPERGWNWSGIFETEFAQYIATPFPNYTSFTALFPHSNYSWGRSPLALALKLDYAESIRNIDEEKRGHEDEEKQRLADEEKRLRDADEKKKNEYVTNRVEELKRSRSDAFDELKRYVGMPGRTTEYGIVNTFGISVYEPDDNFYKNWDSLKEKSKVHVFLYAWSSQCQENGAVEHYGDGYLLEADCHSSIDFILFAINNNGPIPRVSQFGKNITRRNIETYYSVEFTVSFDKVRSKNYLEGNEGKVSFAFGSTYSGYGDSYIENFPLDFDIWSAGGGNHGCSDGRVGGDKPKGVDNSDNRLLSRQEAQKRLNQFIQGKEEYEKITQITGVSVFDKSSENLRNFDSLPSGSKPQLFLYAWNKGNNVYRSVREKNTAKESGDEFDGYNYVINSVSEIDFLLFVVRPEGDPAVVHYTLKRDINANRYYYDPKEYGHRYPSTGMAFKIEFIPELSDSTSVAFRVECIGYNYLRGLSKSKEAGIMRFDLSTLSSSETKKGDKANKGSVPKGEVQKGEERPDLLKGIGELLFGKKKDK